jgi:hypothetical protein
MEKKYSIVDKETGEVIGDYEPKRIRKHSYRYHITFHFDLFKSDVSISPIMQLIISQMDGKNRLYMGVKKRKTFSRLYKISYNSLNTTIMRMKKLNMLAAESPAYFFINPYYFTKTNLRALEQLRREYSELLYQQKQVNAESKSVIIARLKKQIQKAVDENKFEKAQKLKEKLAEYL